MDLDPIEFETNSKSIVNVLRMRRRMQTYWVRILKVIHRNLGLFQWCIVKYVIERVIRQGNSFDGRCWTINFECQFGSMILLFSTKKKKKIATTLVHRQNLKQFSNIGQSHMIARLLPSNNSCHPNHQHPNLHIERFKSASNPQAMGDLSQHWPSYVHPT
jgi:hypothetical protein